MKNLNQMENLVKYAQSYGVDFVNDYGEYCQAYFIDSHEAYINFPNKYSVSILKQKEIIDNIIFEYIDVMVFDWDGWLNTDILYGVCEDNHIPCKNEKELISILETIRSF